MYRTATHHDKTILLLFKTIVVLTMEFLKYQHLERFGTTEVQHVELGECFVFPKLDGSNSSVWLDNNGDIQAGSKYVTTALCEKVKAKIEAEQGGFGSRDIPRLLHTLYYDVVKEVYKMVEGLKQKQQKQQYVQLKLF